MTRFKVRQPATEKVLKDLIRKVDSFKADIDYNLKDIRVKIGHLATKISIETQTLQGDLEDYDQKSEKRYDKAITHLVDIAGKFKKFDEEQTILSDKVSDHSDRIEKLEGSVFKSS